MANTIPSSNTDDKKVISENEMKSINRTLWMLFAPALRTLRLKGSQPQSEFLYS
jgi:hypothetical protein